MKYFEYIAILGFFITAIGMTFYFCRKLKIYHFYRLIKKGLIKKQQKNCGEQYLPSFYLRQIVALLIKNRVQKALIYLCVGRTSYAICWLKKHQHPFLCLILEALRNKNEAIVGLKHLVEKKPNNHAALAELSMLYFLNGEKSKAQLCLNNISNYKAKDYAAARFKYLQAHFDMHEGDMLGASENCAVAANIFHKMQAEYEEGMCYLLMGIIYRVAIIPDVAQLMFDTALKVFILANFPKETSITYTNLGMLMAIQRRFEEAEAYYQKAKEISQKLLHHQSCAEIYNQQGWLSLMQNNPLDAEILAQKALKIHMQTQNSPGIAFSKELLSNAALIRKDFKLATQMAFEAKNLYKEHHNISAQLENFYLMALALFEQNKMKEAEKALREIIVVSEEKSSNFHTANAYNLLGLIYLKKNDLRRAKGLFQQSLDLEQINNRLGGIATDYANIGLIELKCGNKEQAQKTLQTALEYAEANQENDLVEILKKQLEQISED